MFVKNLSQLKKWARVGSEIELIENVLKPQNEKELRVIEIVQTNGFKTRRPCGNESWIKFQKASKMRFNEDNTIDFIFGEQVNDKWVKEILDKQGKDYWLKMKLIKQ